MPISLYNASIGVFVRHLTVLSALLKKAEDHASTNNISASQILETKLAPDMAALPFQIQRASDTAKGAAVRIGGIESVSFPDTEKTFEDLQSRIQKTISFLETVDKDSYNEKTNEKVVLKMPSGEREFTGETYVTVYAVPNFYFHVVTAYDIIRHAGVPVGKLDFLGVTR